METLLLLACGCGLLALGGVLLRMYWERGPPGKNLRKTVIDIEQKLS